MEEENKKLVGLDAIKAALTGESNVGLEFLPTEWKEEIIEMVRVNSWARQAFPELPMERETVKIPSITASVTFYGYPKADVDGVTQTAWATDEVQWDLKTFIANVPIKRRVIAYGIAGLMNVLKQDIANELVYQEENVIINGDAGDDDLDMVYGTGSILYEIDGLRSHCFNNGLTHVDADGSGLSLTHIRTAISTLGKYGVRRADLILLVNLGLSAQMMGWEQVQTVDKYGPKATILTGEIGKLYGMTVIATDLLAETMDTSGQDDDGATTVAIVVNKNSPLIGVPTDPSRKFTLEVDVQPDKDLVMLAPKEDFAFNLRWSTAVVQIYNINPSG